jgi:hypothetical protein
MSLGPVEVLAIEFPGNEFRREILPALKKLIDQETIRIIDLVFITRDDSGVVHSRELTEVEPDLLLTWDPLVEDVLGLLSSDDIAQIGQSLQLNSSAALMLFENRWATEFRDAVLRAQGRMVLNERVPKAVIDQLEGAAQVGAPA